MVRTKKSVPIKHTDDGSTTAAKITRRRKRGTVALQEIKKNQNSVKLLLKKRPVLRLIREVMIGFGEHRLSKQAVEIIQIAAEDHAVSILEMTQALAIHAGRQTITRSDLHLARAIRAGKSVINVEQNFPANVTTTTPTTTIPTVM